MMKKTFLPFFQKSTCAKIINETKKLLIQHQVTPQNQTVINQTMQALQKLEATHPNIEISDKSLLYFAQRYHNTPQQDFLKTICVYYITKTNKYTPIRENLINISHEVFNNPKLHMKILYPKNQFLNYKNEHEDSSHTL